MKRHSNNSQTAPPALVALRRAARAARELAKQTGTSCHIEQNGKIVDIAARDSTAAVKRRNAKRS